MDRRSLINEWVNNHLWFGQNYILCWNPNEGHAKGRWISLLWIHGFVKMQVWQYPEWIEHLVGGWGITVVMPYAPNDVVDILMLMLGKINSIQCEVEYILSWIY